MRQPLFFIAFAFLIGHELDAMTHHEWRLLPLLNLLPDEAGRAAFVAIHVPLIAGLLWLHAKGGAMFHISFGGFCVLHVGLHAWFEAHPLYTFDGLLSEALIWGAGVFGAALAMTALRKRDQT
jgi:hypothetical protein